MQVAEVCTGQKHLDVIASVVVIVVVVVVVVVFVKIY